MWACICITAGSASSGSQSCIILLVFINCGVGVDSDTPPPCDTVKSHVRPILLVIAVLDNWVRPMMCSEDLLVCFGCNPRSFAES